MEVGWAELLKLWEGVLPEERISLVKNRVALRAVGVVWLMEGSTSNCLVLCGAKEEFSLWEILKAWESLVCTEVGNKVVVSVFDIVDSCEMEDVRESVTSEELGCVDLSDVFKVSNFVTLSVTELNEFLSVVLPKVERKRIILKNKHKRN